MSIRTALALRLRRWANQIEPNLEEKAPVVERTRYFYLGPDVALARLTDGHHIYVDPQDETVSAHLIAHGYWEQWIHQVVRSLVAPGDRIVEVGANLGYYTLALAHLAGEGGHVITFEANPNLCSLVNRTILFNGYRDRVTIRNQAASDQGGPMSFTISRANSGGGHAALHSGWAPDGMKQIEVEGVRLDDAVEGEINLLRMDAEGSEPLILRGAERLLKNPEIIVVLEWDVVQMSGRASVSDLADWLSMMGMKFWRIQYDASLYPVAPEDLETLTACDLVMSRRMVGPALTSQRSDSQTHPT
jgi:FkbM family methyltransferase